MKNLTISLEDDLHSQSRIRAARAGMSMSKYIASLVAKDAQAEVEDTDADRRRRLDTLEKFLGGAKLNISENGRMPTAEERNARR